MVRLPKGIGLVRVATPLGTRVLVSDRLSPLEEEVGRIAASALGKGCPVVLLSELEIARLVSEAAA